MKPPQPHYSSFFGLLIFGAAAVLLFVLGCTLGVSALFNYLNDGSVAMQSAIYSVVFLFLSLLLGLISVISFLRFHNKPFADVPVSTSIPGMQIGAAIIGTGLVLIIGSSVQDINSINWLALPLLSIPAVILPIWTITALGIRGISIQSRWRTAGVLGISLTVTPFILFMLEVLLVIAILVIMVIYAAFNLEVLAEFEGLSRQLMFIDLESEEAGRLIVPYILKPVVILPIGIVFSVFIPLIEELIKPLAVWLLAGKLESAAQGFAFGALSGAGFAIIETFNISGQAAEWGVLLFTRIGTGLLHITTSAIMGAAIFMAVQHRRYLRLLANYLLAVFLHGLWNAAAIAVSFSGLASTYNRSESYSPIQWISTMGLAVLAIVLIMLLVTTNRRLKHGMPVEITVESPGVQNNPEI